MAAPAFSQVQHRQSRLRPGLLWLGPDENLQVHKFKITAPLTYISSDGPRATDPSAIDPTLPLRAAADTADLPYWPWYARVTPEQRHLYLAWLAGGRTSLPPAVGYLFIYYYGLERRALIDDADQELVISEVARLRQLFERDGSIAGRNSFMNYSSGFLWFLAAHRPQKMDPETVEGLARSTHVWNEDKGAAALAWCTVQNQPLPAWLAMIIAEQWPGSQRSVVTKRVPEEFSQLFKRRFLEKYGDSLQLNPSKRQKRISYRPASAALNHFSISVPTPVGVSEQFHELSRIWNGCIADLRKLSTVARSGSEHRISEDAWNALPLELRAGIDHPYTDSICDLVAARSNDEGHVFIKAEDIAAATNLSEQALTIGKCRRIATVAEHVGFALEPDARLTGRAYKQNTVLAVFPQAYEGTPDYARYGGAACMMRLAWSVAESDGKVDERELRRVRDHIEDGFELNEHERRRLEVLQALLTKTGSDVAGLGKRIQEIISEENRRSIGRLLVAVAACDGVLTDDELRALRKCFRCLGLTADVLDSLLNEFSLPREPGPVTVENETRPAAGERIPRPPVTVGQIVLDRDAIRRVMHATKEVGAMLVSAMDMEDDAEEGGVATVSIPCTTALEELQKRAESATCSPAPGRYGTFCSDLVKKDSWARLEAEELARRHGHMLNGAIEAINDWAFNELGAQLVYDDGRELLIEKHLLAE